MIDSIERFSTVNIYTTSKATFVTGSLDFTSYIIEHD